MAGNERHLLIERVKWYQKFAHMTIVADPKELQYRVGISEEQTDEVLRLIVENGPSTELLPVLNLLMLERYEATVPLVRHVLDKTRNLEYIRSLQKSRFYLQRMSIPGLSSGLAPTDRRDILHASLRDPMIPVVRMAVRSIVEDSPYEDAELLEIAEALGKSSYVAVQLLAVDILSIRTQDATDLLDRMLRCAAWKVRLRVAALMGRFSSDDQMLIIQRLIADPVEQIRVEVAKRLNTLDYLGLLKDTSSDVRATYLANVIDQITDYDLLAHIAADPCWEVRRVVLELQGEAFKRIAIPLILNSGEPVEWRLSHELLGLIEMRVRDPLSLEFLIDFLFIKLTDKVAEVRLKAGEVLASIIRSSPTAKELASRIEAVAHSSNYLHRMAITPVAIRFDNLFNTNLSDTLRNDKVPNVREYFNDCLREYKGEPASFAMLFRNKIREPKDGASNKLLDGPGL